MVSNRESQCRQHDQLEDPEHVDRGIPLCEARINKSLTQT
jgi:hypothetical protein